MAVHCNDVTWNPDAPLTAFRSSDWAERLFCAVCGSNLSYRSLNGAPSEQVLSLGAFDDPECFPVTSQIYIDEKPDTYALANIAKSLTGPEVMAMFALEGEVK
jgi:hypothetical protein